MNNLLDTYAFLWYINGDEKLSAPARKLIANKETTNFISIASLWEIAIKVSYGKLEIKDGFLNLISIIEKNAFKILSVTFEETVCLTTMELHHRDPFDRMIIAHAITNKLKLISLDKVFQ